MLIRTLILLLVTATSMAQSVEPTPSVQLDPIVQSSIDSIVSAEIERQNAVGVAIGVVQDGQVVFTKGYGFADREEQIPVTNDTMFRWASISKPLTALIAGQLAAEGALDLDKDIRTYVPEFPEKNPEHPMTTRQLLGHLGGIVHYTNGPVIPTIRKYDSPHPYESVILAIDTFKKSPLVAEPGAEFNYSTHGYILASAVVERAGGKPFNQLIQERISQPLNLQNLRPDYQWEDIPNRTVGYRSRGGTVVRSTNTDVSWKLGGGGFISTIDDLAAFAAGLTDPEFMTPELRKSLWMQQETTSGSPTRYGLGFRVKTEKATLPQKDRLVISHSGAQEKTRTIMLVFPEEKAAVVVMTNSEYVKPLPIARAISARMIE